MKSRMMRGKVEAVLRSIANSESTDHNEVRGCGRTRTVVQKALYRVAK